MLKRALQTLNKNYTKRILQITAQKCFSHTKKDTLGEVLTNEISGIKQAGTWKEERIIITPQSAEIKVKGTSEPVLNFCANNYLGLSNNRDIINAAKSTLDSHAFGMSSVRFICGTQDIHKQLEKKISEFHQTEDTILFSSAFDANAGLFEAILTDKDAVISDALNHASIIDGIRLCKAARFRYKHLDMVDLENILKQTQDKRIRLIATDGIFSMDGDIAPLDKIVALAEKYKANIFVDDSHATGHFGPSGKGTPEYFGVIDKIDIVNSTLGKALGGATGGYTTGRGDVVAIMRQKARPYLFSNAICPPVVGASLKVLEILTTSSNLRDRLNENTKIFREGMKKAGFKVIGNDQCPICPVMLGDAKLAADFADKMLQKGIYVIGFSYPVVPRGEARIRVQLSAAHTPEQVQRCVDAFVAIGKEMGVIQ